MNTTALLLALLLVPGAKPTRKQAVPAKAEASKREFLRRSVTIDDTTRDVAVHVSGGNPTTLVLPQKVARFAVIDAKGIFPADKQAKADRMVILLPERDVPTDEVVTLQLTLEDGTLLPPILLSSVATDADLYIDFVVALQQRASADSAAKLRTQLSEVQGKLDDCEAAGGERGAIKVAELVLRQDWAKPTAFVVEQHPTRRLDKQSALLVQTRHVYRLFDATYLVLTVENRDPEKRWILERALVAVEGGDSTNEARVLDVAQDMVQGIPPGEEARVVVAFKTPAQTVDHQYTVQLLEKAGNRHVKLEGLKL